MAEAEIHAESATNGMDGAEDDGGTADEFLNGLEQEIVDGGESMIKEPSVGQQDGGNVVISVGEGTSNQEITLTAA